MACVDAFPDDISVEGSKKDFIFKVESWGQLKPKEMVKKAYYQGKPMVWVEAKKKWFVVLGEGDWREFADKEEKIEWVEEKK